MSREENVIKLLAKLKLFYYNAQESLDKEFLFVRPYHLFF